MKIQKKTQVKIKKQFDLIPKLLNSSSFGGDSAKGKRKSARPISTQKKMHIVPKSEKLKFIRNLKYFGEGLKKFAQQFDFKLYDYKFKGSHVHIVLRFYRRDSYAKFIRAFTGFVATKAGQKGLFNVRPFTRFIEWGKDALRMADYLLLNEFETKGLGKTQGRKLLAQLRPDS